MVCYITDIYLRYLIAVIILEVEQNIIVKML